MTQQTPLATIEEFDRIDIRVGTVTDAQPLAEARKPAIKLWIDFGPGLGVKQSSAQVTVHYKPDQLIGRQVCAVVNFPPRRIAGFDSEVLTLGMPDANGDVVLVRPDLLVPNGGRLFCAAGATPPSPGTSCTATPAAWPRPWNRSDPGAASLPSPAAG